MELEFTKQQQLLRTSVREFLKKESPMPVVRETLNTELGCTRKVWDKMASLGWLGILIEPDDQGSNGDMIDFAIIMEQMGAACFKSPFFSTVVSGIAVQEAGSEDQKNEILPKVADGKLLATMAIDEQDAWFGSPYVKTTAVDEGDHYVITGSKFFVLNAGTADRIICLARTSIGGKREEGLTFLIVDGNAEGMICNRLDTISHDNQNEVVFKNVRVHKSDVLGDVGKAWQALEKINQCAAVAKSAESLGGIESVMEISAAYAKERKQFGRPLGEFQTIAHNLAQMKIDVDASRVLTYQAAWRLSRGLPAKKEVSMAKSFVNEASRRVLLNGHQIHGAMGFCDEHDMHFYYRNAKSTEMQFGDCDHHLEKIAIEIGL